MPKPLTTLFKAGQFSTMVSSRPANTLKPDEFPDITNFRNRYGSLVVRPGFGAWTFTGLPATPEFCAAWSGTWYGDTYVILAIKSGTDINIYDSADGLAFTLRGKAAADTGIFPNTNLSYSEWQANGITFVPVNDTVQTQGVLISDGQTVLLWTPTLTTLRVRKISAFTGTMPLDSIITGSPYFLWNGASLATISEADTGTTFTPSEPGGVQVVIANPQVNNDDLTFTFTSTVSTALGKQLFFLFAQTDTTCTIFASCKVEVYNGTTWFTVFDPSSTDYNDPTVEILDDDYGIGSKAVLYTWGLTNGANTISGSISDVKFTYKGTTDKFAAATLQLLAAGLGALGIAGTPNYGVTYASTYNWCETGLSVLDSAKATGIQTAMLMTTGTKYFKFPVSSILRLKWNVKPIPYPSPTIYNQTYLYRKDEGSSEYLYCANTTVSDWTGHAGIPADTWVEQGDGVILDNVDENALDPERVAPSVYNGVIPGFTCGISANDRTIIGDDNEYRFSEYRFPLRFASIINPDNFDRSSGGFKFANELPKAFTKLPSGANVQEVGMFTDSAFYSISGIDAYSLMRPSLLSQVGTLSPKSVVTRRGDTFMLDDARNITQFPINPTVRRRSDDVKNVLEGITSARLPYVNSAVLNDRFYLFYTQSGQSVNNTAFVIDLMNGSIVRETYGTDRGVVCTFMFEGNLIACLADGTAFEVEGGGSGTVGSCSLVSRELTSTEATWAAERQHVYSNDNESTPTMSWINYPAGDTVTATLDLDPATGNVRADRYTALGKGARGKSIQFSITGTLDSGTEIYDWQVETSDRVSQADTA